jgi:HEAT repeat protein
MSGLPSMTPLEFQAAIEMLRSSDPMTYEDGYMWLQGPNLLQYSKQIATLLLAEHDPHMRGRFVELIGNADLPDYIPLLVNELSHDDRMVRCWAYSGLTFSEHDAAKAEAQRYFESHPEEDFY